MQRLHTFTLQELQRIIKIAERHLPLLIIIPIFAQCSPFVGLVEKYRALSHLRLIFFCSDLNFSPKTFGGFKETRYICSILQNYTEMTTTLLKRQFLHAMVWKAETPQCPSIRHRTPKACLFTIPKNYTYDCKNQFGR